MADHEGAWSTTTASFILDAGSGGATTTIHAIYDDSLASGWSNWSWDSTQDFSATTTYSGTYAVKQVYTAAWGGLFLHNTDSGVTTASSTHLQLAFQSASSSPTLKLEVRPSSGITIGDAFLDDYVSGGSISANTWYQISIPLTDLNATSTSLYDIILLKDSTGTVYYDNIRLVHSP